jgi:glycosyltransferase involved in cell wall biosynthesis
LFIQQLVKELKLRDDVLFLGEVDYIEQVLRCADLFLLPSEQESFGLVALEAMNCGVPVVGTQTGGVPEVVVHGETGFLFPVGEINLMVSAALDLLGNEEKYRHFAAASRQRARQFDMEKILPEWESFYYEVLG